MIKRIIKNEVIKKTLLVILIIIMVSVVNPLVSNAGIGLSILTKPISSMIMGCMDAVNAMLTTIFAPDTKYTEAINRVKGAGDTEETGSADEIEEVTKGKDSKTWYEKIYDGLDNMRSAYYNLLLSPEDIFSNKVQITNANIFSSEFDEDGKMNVSDWNLFNHLMKQLKQATAGLYYITRNLAVVILLCLLIYAGIRIVLSSNVATERAKWKEYLYDWLKALALVMFVHIIMIGIFYISDVITSGLIGTFNNDSIVANIRRNFDDSSALDVMSSIVYIIMYGYITYLTIVFLLAYFKRLFYIIAMVVVAPIISSLYALGKTGKQRFNKWFQEFVMGVMVQPFQLLIYSVLFLIPIKVMTASGFKLGEGVGTVSFSTLDTQIFALIAISMIRPIEKFMRNIFGFTGTALDNVASFESGKRTLDKGTEAVKQVAKTAVMVGGAIATGGTSLAMSGGTMNSAKQFLDNNAPGSPLDNVLNNPTGGIGSEEEGSNMLLDEVAKNPAGGINSNQNNVPLDEPNVNNPINLKEDTMPLNQLNNKQGKEEINSNGEKLLDKNELESGKSKLEDNNEKSNANINLNSANIQINNANDLGIGNTNDANINNGDSIKLEQGNDIEKTENKNEKEEKPKIGGQDLSAALLDRFGAGMANHLKTYGKVADKIPGLNKLNIGDKMDNLSGRLNLESLSESPLLSPEMLEQYEKSRQSLHGLTDTFYVDAGGTNGDWKNNITAEFIKEQKEQNEFSFVNNQGNIEGAIKLFKLDEKKNDNGKIISRDKQEELAKEKLKTMAPYAGMGISDLSTIKGLMDRNIKPDRALQTLNKDNKATMNYNKFVDNKENIQVMQNIAAEKMGKLDEFKAGNQSIIQQVNQQVNQTISDGRQYITSGAAKDPETLNRLVELERKMDSKVTIEGSRHYSKSQYIVGIDKVIEKAVKNNVKSIKLPVNKKMPINDTIKQKNSNAEKNTKALENAMNEVLKERRTQLKEPERLNSTNKTTTTSTNRRTTTNN